MKDKKLSVLFMDNLVASKNFACHFLHYNVFCLQPLETKTINAKQFNFKQKQIFDIVICLAETDIKTCENIKNSLNIKGLVLTNNISSYLMFKQKNINCCFFCFNKCVEQQQEKISITCMQELLILPNTISVKTDDLLISKFLSKEIINASVGVMCVLKNKSPKSLILKFKAKKQILLLIYEQILLTNSVMLTIEKYKSLNFYSFLSGKGLFKKICRNIKLSCFLFSLNEIFTLKEVINSVENLSKINFNNYVEIKNTQKYLQKLNKLKEN